MYPNQQVPDVETTDAVEAVSDVSDIAECKEYMNVRAKVACELDSYKMVAEDWTLCDL